MKRVVVVAISQYSTNFMNSFLRVLEVRLSQVCSTLAQDTDFLAKVRTFCQDSVASGRLTDTPRKIAH